MTPTDYLVEHYFRGYEIDRALSLPRKKAIAYLAHEGRISQRAAYGAGLPYYQTRDTHVRMWEFATAWSQGTPLVDLTLARLAGLVLDGRRQPALL